VKKYEQSENSAQAIQAGISSRSQGLCAAAVQEVHRNKGYDEGK